MTTTSKTAIAITAGTIGFVRDHAVGLLLTGFVCFVGLGLKMLADAAGVL